MNLIDSFVVEIGLDSGKFEQGKQQSLDGFDRAKARLGQDANEIEKQVGGKFEEAMTKVTRQIIALFGVFVAARGLKDFIAQTTQAEVNLGLISSALGVAPQRLSAFEQAVQRLGGTTEDAVSALSNFNQMVQGWENEGRAPSLWFSAIGGGSIDFTKGDNLEHLIQIADLIERSKSDTATKSYILAQMGFTSLAVQKFLMQGGAKVRQQLGRQSETAITKDQVASGDRLYAAFADVQNAISSFGREVLEKVEPVLTAALGDLRALVDRYGQFVANWIGDKIVALKSFVDGGGLDGLKEAITSLAKTINSVAEAIGGWHKVSEGLFVLWGTSKLTPMAEGVAAIVAAMTGVGTGLWPAILALGAVLALYATVKDKLSPENTPNAPASPASPEQAPRTATPSSPGDPLPTPASLTPIAGQKPPQSRKSAIDDVSENKPLPVKMTIPAVEDDTFWGLVGRLFGKVTNWISGAMPSARAASYSGPHARSGGGVNGSWTPGQGGDAIKDPGKPAEVMNWLMKTFNLSQDQAMGPLGWMGFESGDFQQMHQMGRDPATGDLGYPQWSGSRRTAMETWVKANMPGVRSDSDEASRAYLDYDLKTNHPDILAALQKATTRDEAMAAWVRYEGPYGPGTYEWNLHHQKLEQYYRRFHHDPGVSTGAGPAASTAAANQKQSLNTTHKHITLPSLTIKTASTGAAAMAKEIRTALHRELSATIAAG